MNMSSNAMSEFSKQNGAALVVGLVVLLIMTLLGVSSMSITTTELKMASNDQSHNTSFQAAASIIEFALTDPDVTTIDTGIQWDKAIDTNGDPATQTVINFANSTLTNAAASANVVYSDCRKVPIGSSLRGPTFRGLVHEIRATGTAVNSSNETLATSQQTLGVQTVRPGCPTL